VVSNTMAVSGSGLFAGYPPNMPLYCSWLDCWNHLRSLGQLKRGSSLFFRYYKALR
ncbi:Mitochondrial carrier -like protein 2, partial [Caligus rogercresseyi]